MKEERALVRFLACLNFSHVVDFMVIMPLGPQLMRIFQISPAEFGLLVSSYSISAAVAGLLMAPFADQFNRRKLLLGLFAGFTLGNLASGLSTSFVALMISRAVCGACGGVLGAQVYSVVGDRIPEERRGAATGVVMSAFSIAAVFGVPGGLILANHWGWATPFLMIVLVNIVLFWHGAKVLPDMPAPAHRTNIFESWANLKTVIARRRQLTALLFSAVLVISGFSIIPYLSPYLVSNVGLTEQQLPWIYFFGGIATIFTSRLIGKSADRLGKLKTFRWVAVLSVLPILVVTHLTQLPLPVVLISTTLFMVLVSGRFVPAMAILTSSIETAARGRFLSINSTVQSLAMGLAAFMSGQILIPSSHGLQGYDTAGFISIGMTLLAVWIAGHITQPSQRNI